MNGMGKSYKECFLDFYTQLYNVYIHIWYVQNINYILLSKLYIFGVRI